MYSDFSPNYATVDSGYYTLVKAPKLHIIQSTTLASLTGCVLSPVPLVNICNFNKTLAIAIKLILQFRKTNTII